jgi:2-dehydropantoate 2-reductase
MGSGGLGGYFGFCLARAGNEVHFIARGERLEAIRKNGLRLITSDEDSTIQVRAVENPKDAGAAELVLFCVKTYDTSVAAESILPILERSSTVLTLQNGIENFDQISDIVGTQRVVPGTALIGSEVQAPGVIHVMTQIRKVVFGEINGQKTARAERIDDMLRSAGIDSEVTTDISKLLWQKMMWICGAAGMTSIIRLPVGKLMSFPETREMFKQIMEEVSAVAKAKGVDVGGDYLQSRIDLADHLEKDTTSSMLRDLLGGSKLELDALNGAVVRMGKECGIATPMNWAVYCALRPYLNGLP